jgi:glutathione synthase/RimK-type ligase-like ATP-grasp enzyme
MAIDSIKPQTIGATEKVSFPQFGLIDVLAKVDTGADSSSIWASDIREEDGVLHFKLFDRHSPFFNDTEIATKTYKLQLIKNSFGKTEFRYKVPINMVVQGRILKTRFTLADRSRNNYPILIGRRTIKNKFLVDVSQRYHITNQKLRVIVLVHNSNNKIREQFGVLGKSMQDKAQIDLVRYDDLMVVTDANGTTINVKSTGYNIASYGFIFFLTRARDAALAAMVAAYAKRHGVGFSDQAAILLPADAKSHQAFVQSIHGINTPRTVYMDQTKWAESYDELVDMLGLPFVFKDNRGKKGRNNFLISSKSDFKSACQSVTKDNLQMIAQAFVPNIGYYRLVVMGGREIALAMFRPINVEKGRHLYSKNEDGPAELVDKNTLPIDVRQMAISAAQLLSIDVAGVDILQDKQTSEWYCLDVNSSPQLVAGAFVTEKMQALGRFFIRESKRQS